MIKIIAIKIKSKTHFLVIGAISLLPLTWFKSDYINGGDFSFAMSPTINIWINYMNVWVDKWGTGLVNARAITQLPFIGLMAIGSKLGLTNQLMERLLFVSLFFIAGISMYLLAECLPIKLKNRKLFNYSVALFYLFNPSNLVFGWHFLDGGVFVFAFFPLMLYMFCKWYLEREIKYMFLLSISACFAGYTLSNPLFVLMLWVMFFCFGLILAVLEKDRKPINFLLAFSGLFIFWTAVNAWWFLPLIGSTFDEYAGLAATVGPPELTLRAFSTSASFLNLFRLTGFYWAFGESIFGDQFYTYASKYFTKSFLVMSFVAPSVYLYSLFTKEKKKRLFVFLLFGLLLVLLFLAKGMQPPIGEPLFKLLFKVPFMPAFRAPVQKLVVLIAIILSILYGLGLSRLYAKLIKRYSKNIASTAISLLLLIIGVYSYPLLTGEVIKEGGKNYPSYHVRVPDYYEAAAKWLDNDSEDYRFYSLPMSSNLNIAYRWRHGYIGTDPSVDLFKKRGVFSTADTFSHLPNNLLKESKNKSVYKILRLFNTKYVILHHDAYDLLWADFAGYKKPEFLRQSLTKQKNIKFIRKFGELEFYQLNSKVLLPHVYPAGQTILRNNKQFLKKLAKDDSNFIERPAIFLRSDLNESEELSLRKKLYKEVKPKKFSVKKVAPTKLTISYKSKRPFFVVFQESFHPKWQLSYGRMNWLQKLGLRTNIEERHFKVNGYANAWYVRPGEGTMTIYYHGQSFFNQGLIVSIMTIIISMVYVAYLFFVKGKKNNNQKTNVC